MSTTGLRQFDETLHLTNAWLKAILEELGWSERADAYRALRGTLHAVRDRLPPEACAHLSAQLPMLIRGIFFEGWRPGRHETVDKSAEAFLDSVHAAFKHDSFVRPQVVARAAWRVLSKHVSEGEVEHALQTLPKALRDTLV